MARLSISYDDNLIRLAAKQGGRYFFGKALLPAGVVQDGLVVQTTRFSAAIRQVLVRNHFPKIRTWRVILAPPEGRMITKLVELPRVPAAELDSFIRLQARTFLPIEPELLALDYQMVTSRTPDKALILLIASPHEVIDALWQTFTELGFILEAVLPRSTALAQLAYDAPHTPKLLVDVEDDRTLTLIVTKNRTARFSTTVALGRNSQQIRSSIEQAIKYYEQRDGQQRRVQEILVLPSPHANRLIRLLKVQTNLPAVRLLTLPPRGSQHSAQDVQSLVNLGLLKVSTRLNLLKSGYLPILQMWQTNRLLRWVMAGQVAGAIFLVVIVSFALWSRFGKLQDLRQQAAVRPALSVDPQIFLDVVEDQRLQQQLTLQRSETRPWLDAINLAQPPTVNLIKIEYQANINRLTLLGQRSTRRSLVDFIRALRQTFPSVTLPTADWAESEGGLFHLTIQTDKVRL